MAEPFEVLNLGKVEKELRIEIGPGAGWNSSEGTTETDIYIKPPLGEVQHDALLHNVGLESSVGELLVAGAEEKGVYQKHTVEGAPSDEHLALGIELAEAIMTLRGLKAAKVVSSIGGKLETRLVLSVNKVISASE